MKQIIITLTFVFSLCFLSLPLKAEVGDSNGKGLEILKTKCASCHDITGPSPKTFDEAFARVAPDLFYAGIKYKKDWLVNYAQNPVRTRPAGYRYFDHIKRGEREDVVDESTFKPHIKLSKGEAELVATTLMTFKAMEDKITKNALTVEPANDFMGEMYFDKLSGCLACHQIEPDYGGYTGPEVYTIGKRLQEDFVYSYTKNPQAFDPKSTMPNKELSEKALQTIVKYILSIGAK